MIVLECKNILKTYSIDFGLRLKELIVKQSEVVVLLGANGSGKSTLMKIIMDLIYADSGEIKIEGINSKNYLSRNNISYMPEKYDMPIKYKVIEILLMFGNLKSNDKQHIKEQINKLAVEFNAVDYLHKRFGELSKGMAQTVILMLTLLGNKQLLILDEPFSGLDPVQKKQFINYLNYLKNTKNVSILYSTHYLNDVENLGDKIYLIKKGEILDESPVSTILREYNNIEEYFHDKY